MSVIIKKSQIISVNDLLSCMWTEVIWYNFWKISSDLRRGNNIYEVNERKYNNNNYKMECMPGNKVSTNDLIKLIYVITECCLKILLSIWNF